MRLNIDRLTALGVLAPSVILLAIFVYGFIGQTFYIATTNWQGLGIGEISSVGLRNFEQLFIGSGLPFFRFREALVNTVVFTVLFIAVCLSLGLLLAILLDQRIRAEALFRTIFLFPMALSFVVTGTVWRWLFSPRSGLNTLPTLFGGAPLPPDQWAWFTDRRQLITFTWADASRLVLIAIIVGLLAFAALAALRRRPVQALIAGMIGLSLIGWFFPGGAFEALGNVVRPAHGVNIAMLSIVIAATWQMSGYTMAMYLAALRGIPEELREAARVDGCNELQVYRHIVLPLLQPITLSAMIILGHISLKIFDLIYVMAGGDNLRVDVPGIHMYLTAFRGNNFALGAAIAVIMLLLVACVIVPYLVNAFRTEVRR
jgi:glucose/mannose transport system permease protein